IGLESGTAYGATGGLMGAMGVDIADYDGDGLADIIVNTFSQDTTALFHNDGGLLFSDQGVASGIGVPGMPYVKFGVGLVDLDLDGQLEVLMSAGHIRDNADKIDPSDSYAQPCLLFDQQPRGHFVEVSRGAGEAFRRPYVGRGIAFGDVDNDGRLDALIGDLEGPVLLLLNRTPYGDRHWLGLSVLAEGAPALGARVLCETPLGQQFREVRTAYSVMSANDPRVHFGLSTATAATVTVLWTDGSKWGPQELAADAYYQIDKGQQTVQGLAYAN
ncbi:MAG: CRTAC1 family protein, partial [Armatimonadota bacterium]